jgi:hypothetical protein
VLTDSFLKGASVRIDLVSLAEHAPEISLSLINNINAQCSSPADTGTIDDRLQHEDVNAHRLLFAHYF